MSTPYYETIRLIEHLHRNFLDVLKVELDRKGIQDINNVQAMILHNIGTDEMTVGELTLRGYYLGSNVSYNVKKMVENGYLVQERSVHDKRSIRVHLSDKGKELDTMIGDILVRQEARLNTVEITNDQLDDINKVMTRLERFWAGLNSMGGLPEEDTGTDG